MLPFIRLGFDHISDINGYDHILFLIALAIPFLPADWKQLLVLVTAFTAGHSLTLALAAFGFITVNIPVIEFLIPVTIFLSCLFNFIPNRKLDPKDRIRVHYFLALFFGFIHGMGFSNFFRETAGEGQDWVLQLLGFNIGLELGQLIIVGGILGLSFLVVRIMKVKHLYWLRVVSGINAGFAVYLMWIQKFW